MRIEEIQNVGRPRMDSHASVQVDRVFSVSSTWSTACSGVSSIGAT